MIGLRAINRLLLSHNRWRDSNLDFVSIICLPTSVCQPFIFFLVKTGTLGKIAKGNQDRKNKASSLIRYCKNAIDVLLIVSHLAYLIIQAMSQRNCIYCTLSDTTYNVIVSTFMRKCRLRIIKTKTIDDSFLALTTGVKTKMKIRN